MRTRALLRLFLALASGVAMLAATGASAGNFRSYLSVNGNDANPCTLPAPCRLLPAALAAANDGGEIWMLDSANFNTGTVGINKSVTILAVPGAMGSIVANAADAISINAAGVKVTLRNVAILNLSGTTNKGVSFVQGASLTVEGSEIYGLNTGVAASAAGGIVTIKDTTIRDNETGVAIAGSMRGQLLNSTLLNNLTAGMSASNGAAIAVSGTAISGGGTGVLASAASSTTTQVALSASALSGNVTAVQAIASTGADTAQVMLNNVTFTQNGSGVAITGATASVFSRQNNAFKFNTADIGSGALTPLAAQ
jgi:hypothetical protein